jgi:hypothetical protein
LIDGGNGFYILAFLSSGYPDRMLCQERSPKISSAVCGLLFKEPAE